MKIFSFIIILTLVFIGCDGLSEPQEIDDHEIKSMLTDIEIAFNANNFEDIMAFYSDAFLHNGDYLHQIEILWQVRLNDYESLKLSDIKIDYIDDNKAVLSMKVEFDDDIFYSPEDISDFSYLYLTNSGWKIYGNQNAKRTD